MSDSRLSSIQNLLADFVKERPAASLLGILALLAGLCGGSFLLGSGPIDMVERLFFPTRFITSASGEAGEWYEVYQIDPPQEYDPQNFRGEVPEALIGYIENADESIHIAGFEFDLTPVADALIAAHRRGVNVRWFTDDEHGAEADSDADNGQFQMLRDAGIQVRDDERQSLMHNKFIVFDEEIVWTGSTNITRNGMFKNNNNVLVLYSEDIANRFEKQFTELWQGKSSSERRSPVRLQTTMVEDTPLQVLFAPEDNAMDLIVPLIKRARDSVHFMTFAFTDDEMGAELVRQARQGVDVKGVFESRNATSEFSEIHRLYCNGVDVREDGNPANMHHKVFIIDDQIVITGSYNFSNNSENSNDENLVFLNNTDVAATYQEEFARVWADAAPPPQSDIICPSGS